MMDSPFFRRRAIPVQQQTKPSPKVVSIPVQFIGSERTRSDSAVKIQKVFLGFLVRKSVKTIAAISSEVEEIEKRISKKESVELIRRSDSKERLKVNEMLMRLLFRLDSVRGVDSGVRDYRKKVIKKAIALQEMVDLILSNDTDVEDKQVIVEKEEESVIESFDAEIEEPEKKEENERNNNKEVMERMVEENERMMGLMAELVESNEMQTRLLNSLLHRVEQLERAFVCEKLRKKKKRDDCGTGDCF